MMEMNETASILNNITERSMIILDEIGQRNKHLRRYFDCLGNCRVLARSQIKRPMTLFATHYHELNDMCKAHLRIKNYQCID